MRCQRVLVEGAVGPTVDDETPNRMCQKEATWRIARPGVQPRIRCDEHAQEYRQLPFDDMALTPLVR
jgi:hypothetical protein